jgi:hypothetical protein
MPRAVRPVGVVVVLALSILGGTASLAQQKPGSGQSAPSQPSCTPQRMTQCAEQAKAACGADASCIRQTTNGCLGNCDHP